MSAVRRSILFSTADRYVAQVLLVATTAVMARLLTPAETGIYLLANAVILLGDNFRTFGIGVYIVQAKELRPETVRSAFTVTLLLSLSMGLAIFLAAGEIAHFYDEPELKGLLRLGALGFIAIPFGSPILAILQRELAFSTLAVDQHRHGGSQRRGHDRARLRRVRAVELRLGLRRVRGRARARRLRPAPAGVGSFGPA